MSYQFEELPKRRHGAFLRFVLLLLLAAIIGFGAWVGLSGKRVYDLFTQAMSSYDSLETSLESQDFEAALTSAREAANLMSEASAELRGTQWNIAAKLPVLGQDVNVLRSIGSISGSLADDAVLPVLDSWDRLMADGIIEGSTIDLAKVPDKLSQLGELVTTLQSASSAVDACAEQADALQPSHFDVVNGWSDQLRETVSSVDNTMDQLDGAIDAAAGASAFLTELTSDAAPETTATDATATDTAAAAA